MPDFYNRYDLVVSIDGWVYVSTQPNQEARSGDDLLARSLLLGYCFDAGRGEAGEVLSSLPGLAGLRSAEADIG